MIQDKKAQKVLEEMESFEQQFLARFAINEATGAFLYNLVKKLKPQSILELGTWRGASTIYLALALKENGTGQITTVDIDNNRVEQAADNFKRAGVGEYITQVVIDIEEFLPQDSTVYDFIFMDAAKAHQKRWLEGILKRNTQKGSIIIVDDIILMEEKMKNLINYVENNKNLESSIKNIDDGLMVIEVLQ